MSLDRDTSRLSGGQQQLLAVAAASVAGPHLLLLDEPTANLDPAGAAAVLAAVEAIRTTHGCTVVVVEHRVEAWLERADRVLLVEDGTVLELEPDRPARASRGAAGLRGAGLGRPRPPAQPGAVGAPGRLVMSAQGVASTGRLPPTDLEVRAAGGRGRDRAPRLRQVHAAGLPGRAPGARGRRDGRVGRSRPGGVERTDPWRWPSAEVARTFGVVFQNPEHQFVTGRVADEVHHGLVGAGVGEPEASQRTAAMLDRLHLGHLAAADPFTLSGGEQRRLSVGTALALDPGILLLDEPTFGQDPATWAELVGIIADHRDAGGAVVMATHDPDLVHALGAREVRLAARAGGRRRAPAPGRRAGRPAEADPGARGRGPGAASGPPPPAPGLRRLDPVALLGAAVLLSAAALAVDLGRAEPAPRAGRSRGRPRGWPARSGGSPSWRPPPCSRR